MKFPRGRQSEPQGQGQGQARTYMIFGVLAIGILVATLTFHARWQALHLKLSMLHLSRQSGSQAAPGVTKSKLAAATISTAAAGSVQKEIAKNLVLDECSIGNERVHEHTEYWGDVVVAGSVPKGGKDTGLKAADARGCCLACKSTRGCNTWVWCSDPQMCGQQCWLKRVGNARDVVSHGSGPAVAWTSGHLPKEYDVDPATLPPLDESISHLVITTVHGRIRIELQPSWSKPSVDFVRRIAQQPELCTTQCEFYRAEPGFLLQGSLRAYIPANSKTQEGPKIMERGDIGWAGGGPGPDFFIYLGTQPATHFGKSHTVWGKVADDASLAVVEKIVMLKATAPRPGDMHMLDQRVEITTGTK